MSIKCRQCLLNPPPPPPPPQHHHDVKVCGVHFFFARGLGQAIQWGTSFPTKLSASASETPVVCFVAETMTRSCSACWTGCWRMERSKLLCWSPLFVCCVTQTSSYRSGFVSCMHACMLVLGEKFYFLMMQVGSVFIGSGVGALRRRTAALQFYGWWLFVWADGWSSCDGCFESTFLRPLDLAPEQPKFPQIQPERLSGRDRVKKGTVFFATAKQWNIIKVRRMTTKMMPRTTYEFGCTTSKRSFITTAEPRMTFQGRRNVVPFHGFICFSLFYLHVIYTNKTTNPATSQLQCVVHNKLNQICHRYLDITGTSTTTGTTSSAALLSRTAE